MHVAPSEIPALTALVQQKSENGYLYVVAPKTGAVTADYLHFFESSFEVAAHFNLEPEEEDLYDTHGVTDVLRAFDLVTANQEARSEFTDSTLQQPLLDIGKITTLFNRQYKLTNQLCDIDWYEVEDCIKVLSATSTGIAIGREVWQEYAPQNLMPLPAGLKDTVPKQKKQRTFQPSGSRKNSQKK